MCQILEMNAVLGRSQGNLPVPAWEPAEPCDLWTHPLPAGESRESIGKCQDGVGPGFRPIQQKNPG
jgi:hypothetical protein